MIFIPDMYEIGAKIGHEDKKEVSYADYSVTDYSLP
jgi:hypothetical protein